MTTQNLLDGLKELLTNEYEKAGIELYGKDYKHSLPNVYIGFLPTTINDKDFPSVVIIPPTEAEDDGEHQIIPISLCLGVLHKDSAKEPDSFMDILTLAERTKEILIRNGIVAGAFRRTDKITWGVDSMAGRSATLAVGELNIKYETRSTYQEII